MGPLGLITTTPSAIVLATLVQGAPPVSGPNTLPFLRTQLSVHELSHLHHPLQPTSTISPCTRRSMGLIEANSHAIHLGVADKERSGKAIKGV